MGENLDCLDGIDFKKQLWEDFKKKYPGIEKTIFEIILNIFIDFQGKKFEKFWLVKEKT